MQAVPEVVAEATDPQLAAVTAQPILEATAAAEQAGAAVLDTIAATLEIPADVGAQAATLAGELQGVLGLQPRKMTQPLEIQRVRPKRSLCPSRTSQQRLGRCGSDHGNSIPSWPCFEPLGRVLVWQ